MENKMTVVPKSEIASVRLDKDQDIIPISVGLYRLFLASGAAGREAKDLYEHLIFTARLQETQQVRANNVYLGRGLCWGQAKVKAAKAWLYNAGLIEYVQTRDEGGKLGEVYIKLSFLPRAETVAERLRPAVEEEPAAQEEFRDDLTPDLFAEEVSSTGGSDSDPVVAGGSIYRPAVDRTPGAKRQMLEMNNEMLEVKKGKGEGAPAEQTCEAESPHFAIARAWFSRYARETAIMISPRPDDHKAASELFAALGGNLGALDVAVEAYFSRFRELGLWFAARKASRRGDAAAWIPDWSFRSFLAHYPEIVAAASARPAAAPSPSSAPAALRCPVCGDVFLGTMATCGTCGMRSADRDDPGKVAEHRDWFESRERGTGAPLSIMGMFRGRIAAEETEDAV